MHDQDLSGSPPSCQAIFHIIILREGEGSPRSLNLSVLQVCAQWCLCMEAGYRGLHIVTLQENVQAYHCSVSRVRQIAVVHIKNVVGKSWNPECEKPAILAVTRAVLKRLSRHKQ
jgi:hypothetical protein